MNLKYLAIAALALVTTTSGWCNTDEDCDRATKKQCGVGAYAFCKLQGNTCITDCSTLRGVKECNRSGPCTVKNGACARK